MKRSISYIPHRQELRFYRIKDTPGTVCDVEEDVQKDSIPEKESKSISKESTTCSALATSSTTEEMIETNDQISLSDSDINRQSNKVDVNLENQTKVMEDCNTIS